MNYLHQKLRVVGSTLESKGMIIMERDDNHGNLVLVTTAISHLPRLIREVEICSSSLLRYDSQSELIANCYEKYADTPVNNLKYFALAVRVCRGFCYENQGANFSKGYYCIFNSVFTKTKINKCNFIKFLIQKADEKKLNKDEQIRFVIDSTEKMIKNECDVLKTLNADDDCAHLVILHELYDLHYNS